MRNRNETTNLTRVGLLATVLIVGILVAIALPAIQRMREAARFATTSNNLRQLGLAVLNYESASMHFPSAISDGRLAPESAPVSWMTSVLPFVEATNYPSLIDRRFPYDHPINHRVFHKVSPLYESPFESSSYDSRGFALTHYSANPDVISASKTPVMRNQLDGQDLMIGEVCAGYVPWGAPGNVRSLVDGIRFDALTFGSPSSFRRGAMFTCVDGSTRFVESDAVRPPRDPAIELPSPVSVDLSPVQHLTLFHHAVGPRKEVWLDFVHVDERNSKGGRHLIAGPPVSDADIADLAKMPHVVAVSLSNYNQITDKAFASFANMPELRILQFPDNQLTDLQLNALSKSPSLEVLRFRGGVVSSESIEAFRRTMPGCELIVEADKNRKPPSSN